jgi:hypothetical protein
MILKHLTMFVTRNGVRREGLCIFRGKSFRRHDNKADIAEDTGMQRHPHRFDNRRDPSPGVTGPPGALLLAGLPG